MEPGYPGERISVQCYSSINEILRTVHKEDGIRPACIRSSGKYWRELW
jgi:hypothetical protein